MKHVGVVLMWLVASGAATGVAWTGIGVLDDDLVDPAPAVVDNAGGIESEGVEPESSSALLSDQSTLTLFSDADADHSDDSDDPDDDDHSTTSITTTSSSTDTTAGSTTAATAGTSTTSSTSSTSSSSASSSTSPTTSSSSSTTATSRTTNTSTTTATTPSSSVTTQNTVVPSTAVPTQVKTFHLVGGSAAISFSTNGTSVVWATPNPGFEVKVEPEDPGIKVEFRADHHRSRIDAWWENGPRHEIEERSDR